MSVSSVRNARTKVVRQGQGLPKPDGVAQAMLNREYASSDLREPWVRAALTFQSVPK